MYDQAVFRLSAEERLEALCDEGSLEYIRASVASRHLNGGGQPGDGVVAAAGSVHGRPIMCYSQDSSFIGGSLGEVHAASVLRLLTLAEERRVPVVGYLDSAGARMQEGVAALAAYARIFKKQVALRGVIPQISVVSGSCAGGSAYSPALTDFVIMRKGASMFLTGPKVVREAMHEDVSADELGGLDVHLRNGVCDFGGLSDLQCAMVARQLLAYLPQSAAEQAPLGAWSVPPGGNPGDFVPSEQRRAYDMRDVLKSICDGGVLLEARAKFAPNILTCFGRIDGRAVAFVANQPKWLGGVIDAKAAEKAAWFIARTSALNLPLVTFVDTPGFLPGSDQERSGVIRYGAEMLRAFAEARVARITVILRKAYGGAYITMNSRDLGAHLTFAWPDAEIGVMAASQAVSIVNHRVLGATDDPTLHDSLATRYARDHLDAVNAAREGFIDAIIEPEQTRDRLSWGLQILDNRRRRKSDIPPDWPAPRPVGDNGNRGNPR